MKKYKIEKIKWSIGSSENPFEFFPTRWSVDLEFKQRLSKEMTILPNFLFQTKSDAKQFKFFLEYYLPKILKDSHKVKKENKND